MESNKKTDFLTRLEQLQFSVAKSSAENPSSQADANRNLYLYLSEERDKKKSSDYLSYSMEADRVGEMYANVVDNMEESGLNNFADGAMALCHYHKNESSKWQTSLTAHDILSCFKDKKKKAKSDSNDYYADLTIPIKRKRVRDTSRGLCTSTSSIQSALPPKLLGTDTSQPKNPSSLSSTRPSMLLPTKQINNDNKQPTTVPSITSPYHSAFKNNPNCWKKQPHGTHNNNNGSFGDDTTYSIAGVSRSSGADGGIYKAITSHNKESINVSASKVGGPYANFGQKPKKGQNKWSYKKEETKPEEDEEDDESDRQTPFKTAREQFIINQQKKNRNSHDRNQVTGSSYGAVKKSLGTRRGPANKFVPPILGQDSDEGESPVPRQAKRRDQNPGKSNGELEEPEDERLKGIDPNMIELIRNDIMDQGAPITWSDIAGLEFAKKTIQEIVVWPMLRPDIFTGLRGPPKGLLLFGPPGTGKTLIGKCVASQSKSTFFCISASSLTSKWVGEGEKMVRALFAVARCSQPAVVFIDEVDSLLSQRSDSEHESSRRIKTEFLVQLDGASTASDERLLVIGATNRPQEIDEAARRRFVKRLLIPLPEKVARQQIIVNLMSQQSCDLSESDLSMICDKSDGYSGADMSNLCREAALGPIRSIPFEKMETITPDQVRPILMEDFQQALLQVRASVSSKDLELYVDWNKTYGSFGH